MKVCRFQNLKQELNFFFFFFGLRSAGWFLGRSCENIPVCIIVQKSLGALNFRLKIDSVGGARALLDPF